MDTYPDDVILAIRTSEIFRRSVYFINFLGLLALAITVFTILKLYSKQIFSASTTSLLIADVVFINVHNFSYLFVQNWSLYRSFTFSHNVYDIMFRSEECWPHHVTNEFTKTVTLFIQFFLLINRISVTINPQKFSKASFGFILSIFTLAASALFTVQQHLRGPLIGMKTTSCFRESDVVLDLKTEHIIPYIVICTVSIICSLVLIVYVKRTGNKKTYDVMSEYMRKESILSTIAVTIIGTIQLLSFCFYDGLLTIFAKVSENSSSPNVTNVIGWFYTGPFNAIISPSAVLVYIYFIKKNRKSQIKKLTNLKTNHFQQLDSIWK
ncbi:hypothetical protein CAEBREN_30477 [Caenorhabditis brenneri]|uniref:Uncharacterized protein n=1 Tax=Caenorhabditis brenneri TaxID=135651 RepID=G0MN89_CAEBE|nr:hypothetical protein CAEBREN_30477 [Caenorhabditis brenneri]